MTIAALALLLLQADAAPRLDLCTQVKRVVRTSVQAFREVRGSKHEDSAKKVVWTAPEKVPGASVCRVIEMKDGSQPFYVCGMEEASCKVAEERFAALVKDVSQCLDAPAKIEDDGKKRTARLHKGGVPIRATFTRGSECDFRFYVEPIQQDR